MLTQSLIIRIAEQIDTLKQQTEQIDQHNATVRSNRFKYRDIFHPQLFRCDSTKLLDYVLEAEKNFKTLLKGPSYAAHLPALGEKLSCQIAAINQAVKANAVVLKEHNYQSKRAKQRYQQRYKKVASQMMANSHELYEELARNHEFERRLNEMIYERKAQLGGADAPTTERLNREMLALHERLGRCRRAITAVEERIQFAESKTR